MGVALLGRAARAVEAGRVGLRYQRAERNTVRERLDRFAVSLAPRPYRVTAILLAGTAVAIPVFVLLGDVVFGDPAELFRELMPGTWLSFAELGFASAIAWAVHTRSGAAWQGRRLTFWAIAAGAFAVFALDEITQATVFLADGLTAIGASAPGGFQDLDAVLLTGLLAGAVLVSLRFVPDLFRCAAAIPLLALGVLIGASSEVLDASFAATSDEFVVEESLKLVAEPFFIGAFLVALRETLRRSPVSR